MSPELWIGCVAGIVLAMCWFTIAQARNRVASGERPAAVEPEEAPEETDFAPEEMDATVVDYGCTVKMVGIQTPKAVKEFTVVFETDDRKPLQFVVPEEMYDGFEKGQRGLLTVVDGSLYSFEPYED